MLPNTNAKLEPAELLIVLKITIELRCSSFLMIINIRDFMLPQVLLKVQKIW